MEFGLFVQAHVPRLEVEADPGGAEHARLLREVELAETADRHGFKYVWSVEHHFLEEYSHLSASEIVLQPVHLREGGPPGRRRALLLARHAARLRAAHPHLQGHHPTRGAGRRLRQRQRRVRDAARLHGGPAEGARGRHDDGEQLPREPRLPVPRHLPAPAGRARMAAAHPRARRRDARGAHRGRPPAGGRPRRGGARRPAVRRRRLRPAHLRPPRLAPAAGGGAPHARALRARGAPAVRPGSRPLDDAHARGGAPMSALLQDRVAIVSGIGPGLGRAIALACAREGANIVLAARTAAALEAVAAEVRALGRRALAVPTDVARPEDCRRLADAAHAELGRIDVLVNNAFRSAPYEPVEEASMEDWRRIFDVNLFGAVQLSQAVIPHMKARGGGSIVMIGSMSMRVIEPRFGGYAASKAALASAVQTMAKELGASGVRVNSVVPGYIWGPALERYFQQLAHERATTPEAVYAEIASRTSLNHIPDSEEVAAAVVFFASHLARAVA